MIADCYVLAALDIANIQYFLQEANKATHVLSHHGSS
jgi:hypothetical protein